MSFFPHGTGSMNDAQGICQCPMCVAKRQGIKPTAKPANGGEDVVCFWGDQFKDAEGRCQCDVCLMVRDERKPTHWFDAIYVARLKAEAEGRCLSGADELRVKERYISSRLDPAKD